jgi:ubiquinone/menaquinone biosynthesis C-methylase UbiE
MAGRAMDKFVKEFEDRHSIRLGDAHNPFFDGISDQYEDARPGYPAALFDDLGELFPKGKHSSLLEIGAGNGVATVELAKRADKITAIEPGGALIAQAKRKCEGLTNISFEECSFEQFERGRKFDAVAAFTAFHWVRSEQKFLQVEDHLNSGGVFAACWNSYMPPMGNTGKKLSSLISQATHPTRTPLSKSEVIEKSLRKLSSREQELLNQPNLSLVFAKRYITEFVYTPDRYIALLETFPNISSLEKEQKIGLYESVIDTLVGELVSIPVVCSLTVLNSLESQIKRLS